MNLLLTLAFYIISQVSILNFLPNLASFLDIVN